MSSYYSPTVQRHNMWMTVIKKFTLMLLHLTDEKVHCFFYQGKLAIDRFVMIGWMKLVKVQHHMSTCQYIQLVCININMSSLPEKANSHEFTKYTFTQLRKGKKRKKNSIHNSIFAVKLSKNISISQRIINTSYLFFFLLSFIKSNLQARNKSIV